MGGFELELSGMGEWVYKFQGSSCVNRGANYLSCANSSLRRLALPYETSGVNEITVYIHMVISDLIIILLFLFTLKNKWVRLKSWPLFLVPCRGSLVVLFHKHSIDVTIFVFFSRLILLIN